MAVSSYEDVWRKDQKDIEVDSSKERGIRKFVVEAQSFDLALEKQVIPKLGDICAGYGKCIRKDAQLLSKNLFLVVAKYEKGIQSFIEADFDAIPPVVLRLLAQCFGFGRRKYGDGNARLIPIADHLSHAMNHINEFRTGDRTEPHLVNAMTRIGLALDQAVSAGDQKDRYENGE